MGTPEQKAHREAYLAKRDAAFKAAASGQWSDDASLEKYLGRKSPLYNQLYSQGGFSRYGPSWDPAWQSDFEHNQEIPYGDPETQPWYDPSKPENWRNTDPTKAARMAGFFHWGDEQGDMINQRFGGNALAAYLRLRSQSNRPNSPDMSWWNEGNGSTLGQTPPPNAPPPVDTKQQSFWDWLYGSGATAAGITPQRTRLNSLMEGGLPPSTVDLSGFDNATPDSGLGGLKGFDPVQWDRNFNQGPGAATLPASPQPSQARTPPTVPTARPTMAGMGGYNPQANAMFNQPQPVANNVAQPTNSYVQPQVRPKMPARPEMWQAGSQGYTNTNKSKAPRGQSGLIGLGGY